MKFVLTTRKFYQKGGREMTPGYHPRQWQAICEGLRCAIDNPLNSCASAEIWMAEVETIDGCPTVVDEILITTMGPNS